MVQVVKAWVAQTSDFMFKFFGYAKKTPNGRRLPFIELPLFHLPNKPMGKKPKKDKK